jgi:uncharacterized MAPEG superfamily protein
MSVLHWTLLAFAAWTLLVLMGTVGVYRWTSVLSGKARINAFRADGTVDRVEPPGWYRRGMRAHANCVENLPVYTAIVAVVTFSGTRGTLLDTLGIIVLGARIAQSLVHLGFTETGRAVLVRFTFFATQVGCMLAMAGFAGLQSTREQGVPGRGSVSVSAAPSSTIPSF